MLEWTEEAMKGRLVRYADLQACRHALLDSETSKSIESTGKESFAIIGPGVSGSADQHVHIREPHGFSIGGVRQPFGGASSPQYSHDTAEIFVVHSGNWRLHFGPNKEDGSLDISPGDVASVPIHIFRGFSKLDQGKGFLWMPIGQDDPDNVSWVSAVSTATADDGLKTVTGGRMIDTSDGMHELKEFEFELGLNEASMVAFRSPLDKLRSCMVKAVEIEPNPCSPLAGEGVAEAGVIVPKQTSDGFAAGPVSGWWPHNLNLRRLTLESGAYVPLHARSEAEVLFAQSGTLEVIWDRGSMLMGAGDTFSVPVGLMHSFRNTASVPAVIFIVRGTDDPAMPVFASAPIATLANA
jgi:mannose-6-phosphate isomerase-like protein (cupin superfamily)